MHKKIYSIIMALCIVFSVSACGNEKPVNTENTGAENVSITEEKENSKVEIINLDKKLVYNYEQQEGMEKPLVVSEYTPITLRENEVQKYPQLAKALVEISVMQTNSMEDEFENLISFANEALAENAESFETQISTLDVQVRRSDSVAISLLSDSYSDYGMIEEMRTLHGTNYDTKTGQELKVQDVIKDMSKIPSIVVEELNSHQWSGDVYSETAIADYFTERVEDGISWTLDYNGVTFYFHPGDVSAESNGIQTATVAFAKHPELFVEKYMEVPENYMVRLPLDASFFADVNGDNKLEELNCSGYYNTSENSYSKFGLYTDINGSYHYEDIFALSFDPFYVKTADGESYLYLFCEGSRKHNRDMLLVVFNLENGELARVGEMNVCPHYRAENGDVFEVPTNPQEFYLDEFDESYIDNPSPRIAYNVGEDGMPRKTDGDSAETNSDNTELNPDNMKMIELDEESLQRTEWRGYAEVNPESGETNYFPYESSEEDSAVAYIEFYEDNSGHFDYENECMDFTWECIDEYTVCVHLPENRNLYLSLYSDANAENSGTWMMLQLETSIVWLC